MTLKQYPFRYEANSDIDVWLHSQKNKRESLSMLIAAVIKEYGAQQDLREVLTSRLSIQEHQPPTLSKKVEKLDDFAPAKKRINTVENEDTVDSHVSNQGNVLDMLSSL